MRLAICLYGMFNYSAKFEDSGNYVQSSEKIKALAAQYDTDFYIHTWSQDKLVYDVYKPKSIIFEPQRQFSLDIDPRLDRITVERNLSALYSRKQAILLSNQDDYDIIFVGRFDLGCRGKLIPQRYWATDFKIGETDNKLYMRYWDQFNHGIPDHWFYSGKEKVNILGNLADELPNYYAENSEYINAVLTKWPQSSQDQFSNECFKDNPESSAKYRVDQLVDQHKLHKWHFLKNNVELGYVHV